MFRTFYHFVTCIYSGYSPNEVHSQPWFKPFCLAISFACLGFIKDFCSYVNLHQQFPRVLSPHQGFEILLSQYLADIANPIANFVFNWRLMIIIKLSRFEFLPIDLQLPLV